MRLVNDGNVDEAILKVNLSRLNEKHVQQLESLEQSQALYRTLLEQVKSQLVAELFGSQAAFEAEYKANKDSAESILMDQALRKALGLPDVRKLGAAGYTTKAVAATANVAVNVTKVVASKAMDTTKAVVNNIYNIASVPLSYVAGSLWGWYGGGKSS